MPLRRVLSTSWAPVIVTALFTIALLLRYDVGVLDVVVYAIYFALGISLPGVLAWRMLLAHLHTEEPDLDEVSPGEGAGAEDEVGEYEDQDRPGPTWFEDLSLGTIFGFGLQLPFYLLGVAIGVPLLVVILPVAAIAVSFTALGRRTWSLPTGSVDVRAAWAMSITMMYGLAWLGRNVFSRRPLDLPLNKPPSIDETFHQALALWVWPTASRRGSRSSSTHPSTTTGSSTHRSLPRITPPASTRSRCCARSCRRSR